MDWPNWIMVAATCAMAYFAWTSYRLTKLVKRDADKQQKRTDALMQEMLCAMLLVAGRADTTASIELLEEQKKKLEAHRDGNAHKNAADK